jgi:nicotinamide mononucleotide transporter
MNVSYFTQQFIIGIQQTSWYEFVAVIAGVVSVWFSRKENILVYLNIIMKINFFFVEWDIALQLHYLWC